MKRSHPATPAPVSDPPPRQPAPPALEDCCRSGCTPCVFDLYEDAMERYRKELTAWKQRHPDTTTRH